MQRRIWPAAALAVSIGVLLSPLAASAQGANIAEQFNLQCTGTNSGQTCGGPFPGIPGSFVAGECDTAKTCQVVTYTDPQGTEMGLQQAPTAVQNSFNPSLLSQAESVVAAHPFASMIGFSAGSQLISTLITSAGSSGGGGGPNPYAGICTKQYYYSANPNPNDPCAVYSPNGQPNGGTLPSIGAPADCSLGDLIGKDCPLGYTAKKQGTDSNGCTIWQCAPPSASSSCPAVTSCTAGETPMYGIDSNGCTSLQCTGASPNILTSGSTTSGTMCVDGSTCSPSTYCSTVAPGQCIPIGQVDCGTFSCPAGNSCGTGGQCTSSGSTPVDAIISDPSLYVNAGPGPAASSTPLNQGQIPLPQNGLQGDLLSAGGGVTIYARNVAGNATVSGFYGDTGGAGGLCRERPWASNFLSYVIPPGFFDSLCALAGYPGAPPAPAAGLGDTSVVAGPGAPPTPAERAMSANAPQARIGASPSSVNIGGRTTIFWVSRNVSSCEESSSDGNFHGTSVSGGASTVPLSGPVTFSITCLGLDGTSVTDSYTVRIGI